MAEIEIEIDGRKLKATPNQTVIQVADEAGIYIPRFCYHKHLSIPANCRMCLVEVEKAPKALPACATPVAPGMKVFTQSAKTLAAQRAVMSFLLINHPLDCPICDQGGECELQDLSMGYGSPWSQYTEAKRSVADQDLGPLISTEMTRCIYCTRCVRFGDEVAGMRELGAMGRGEFTEISTYIQHSIKSEVSGNIIDLCPVGALTSKPFRFTARAWELDQIPSISPHDCVGANINVHTRYGTVMRVVPNENQAVNGTWLSDRDRFSYTALYHSDRIGEPYARKSGVLKTVDWEEALASIAKAMTECISRHGAEEMGALISPSATLEEFYLLQKMMRALGCSNIDHRLRETDVRDQAALPAFPSLNMNIDEIEQCDLITLIGSNIQKEQPLIGLRIRKATLNQAHVLAINPIDYRFNFKVGAKKIVPPQAMVHTLSSLLAALSGTEVEEEIALLASQLKNKQKPLILLGAIAHQHPEAATLRYLAQAIAEKIGATVGLLTEGGNSAGGWVAGALPHRECGAKAAKSDGQSTSEMLAHPRKLYFLFNVEPELDFADAITAIKAVSQAETVIAVSLYKNPILEDHADFLLPLGPFTETSGTYINAAGSWQSFRGTAKSYAQSRPGWKILRALSNFLQLEGFQYETSEEVKREIESLTKDMPLPQGLQLKSLNEVAQFKKMKLCRVGEIPIYATDCIVRRAKPLQQVQSRIEGDLAVVRLHPQTVKELGLKPDSLVRVKQVSSETTLPLIVDERVAIGAVCVAGGIDASSGLGPLYGEITVEAV